MNVSRETRPFCRKSRTKQALPCRLKQVKGVSRETPFVPNKRMCRKQEAAWISRSAAALRNGAVSSAASPTIAFPSPPAISAPQSLFGGQKPLALAACRKLRNKHKLLLSAPLDARRAPQTAALCRLDGVPPIEQIVRFHGFCGGVW